MILLFDIGNLFANLNISANFEAAWIPCSKNKNFEMTQFNYGYFNNSKKKIQKYNWFINLKSDFSLLLY